MSADFESTVDKLISSMGLEMPKELTNDQHRQSYLNYLSEKGLTEADVAPILPMEKVPPEAQGMALAGFIQALKSDNKKEVAAFIDILRIMKSGQNTNRLIARMAYTLISDLGSAGVKTPEFFAGVYPTGCINAHCVIHDGVSLVLVDSGAFEMVETSVAAFVSKRNETEQAEILIGALEDYFVKGVPPDPLKADHPSINHGSFVSSSLCTAIEEFLITHEIGHIALGHVSEKSKSALPQPNGKILEVQRRDHLQEYHADCWAFIQLIARARKKPDAETAALMACTGALVFLNIGLMIEAMAEQKRLPIRDSHPLAENRLYMIEIACEVLGLNDATGIGRKFHKIVREFCVLLGVDERMPPTLSRDLNRIAIQIFSDLGIDFRHARFLTEFV
jgi:hypothetical protein